MDDTSNINTSTVGLDADSAPMSLEALLAMLQGGETPAQPINLGSENFDEDDFRADIAGVFQDHFGEDESTAVKGENVASAIIATATVIGAIAADHDLKAGHPAGTTLNALSECLNGVYNDVYAAKREA